MLTLQTLSLFLFPVKMCAVQTGVFDVQTGVFDAQTGVFDAQTGVFDVQTGVFDVQTGVFDVQTDWAYFYVVLFQQKHKC